VRSSLLRGLFGIAISAVALFVVVRGLNLAAVGDVLGTANPAWLAGVAACIMLDLLCRSVRWQVLLAPIRHVPIPRTLAYLLIGYLANNVLPARLGELVRSHYLGDREGISRTTTLGTVVVERVVDTAALVAIASAAILLLHVRGIVASAVLLGLGLTGLLVVGLAFALVAHRLPYADRILAAIERWPTAIRVAGKLRGGLAVASRPRTLLLAIAWSLAAWGATVVAFAAAGHAVGIELTWGQAALLAAGTALATAIPAGPANLGTFELAAVRIADVFGIAGERAFALAVLAHAVTLLVTSVGGSVALWRVGWRRSSVPAGDESAS
jgi:glycosyltransferase 2 family protein